MWSACYSIDLNEYEGIMLLTIYTSASDGTHCVWMCRRHRWMFNNDHTLQYTWRLLLSRVHETCKQQKHDGCCTLSSCATSDALKWCATSDALFRVPLPMGHGRSHLNAWWGGDGVSSKKCLLLSCVLFNQRQRERRELGQRIHSFAWNKRWKERQKSVLFLCRFLCSLCERPPHHVPHCLLSLPISPHHPVRKK